MTRLGKGGKLPANMESVPLENQLYVRGLPYNTTDLELHRIFGCFGAIPLRGIKTMLGADGSCSGVAFVDFVDHLAAQKALVALNGIQMADGTMLEVMSKRTAVPKGTVPKGTPLGAVPMG